MKTLTIKLTDLVLLALSLDDGAMQRELGVQVTGSRAMWNDVTGGVENIRTVVDDIHSRAYNESGWDQPKAWESACRRAWRNVVKQLNAQGYDVRVRQGTVTLVQPQHPLGT